jgi:hypothetical protein
MNLFGFEVTEDMAQEKDYKMQYLVRLKLVAQGRPTTRDEAIAFIEQVILPSLEM